MATRSRLVASAFAIVLVTGCTDDILDASYANRAEVEADEAIGRGWVPEWLPAEARQIREVHNVDTNESALAFQLPGGSNWRPPSPCTPAEGANFRQPRFNREWIPELNSRAVYFRCPSEEDTRMSTVEAVAVLPGGEQVLHWRSFAR